MTNAAIRQQLHQYIDIADDKKIEAIFHIIQHDMGEEKYTPEELNEFYSRLEKYTNGDMPTYTMAEAHEYVRQNKKGK